MQSGFSAKRRTCHYWVWSLLVAGLLLFGCSDGNDGAPGAPGAPGISTATISGVVSNASTGAPIAGAVVTTDPAVPGVNIVADGGGNYTATLPVGNYDFTCTAADYTAGSHSESLVAGVNVNHNFALVPETPVKITITGAPSPVFPGDVFGLNAAVVPMDGSTVTGFAWTQTNSVAAGIANGDTAAPTITLPGEQAYRDELFAQFIPLDRWMVQGISPFALEQAGHVALDVAVTTTSGTYTSTVDVHADLGFATVSTGLPNQPAGLPMLFNGKAQTAYDWAITTRPAGSAAAFNDGSLRRPSFTPDLPGKYIVTVTDEATALPLNIEIYAGTWVGAITGQDGNGRPEATDCTLCHNGVAAPDMFTNWKETGHAEIFTDNYNTSSYWGTQCFQCHTVGYNPDAANGGIDEAADYQAFLNTLGSPAADNWTNLLANQPDTARKANVQCENCHGPNSGPVGETAHMQTLPRVSLSSDVCATCHGEPKRHARFQQWELSGHANYELAESRGTSGSCGRCHSANGFVKWVPNLLDADPDNDADSVPVDWTVDNVHPQTCAACHDPHDIGTTSGSTPNARVRITGDTANMEAGFKATAVGKGALCMTCHNSRRGLRNDSTWPPSDPGRATHGRPNADTIMGQNMYFVDVGERSPHSLITNTCVACHMELTDPPEELSYNLGGTNHTFEASDTICSNCHGNFTADTVKLATDTAFADLAAAIGDAIKSEIGHQIGMGFTVKLHGHDAAGDPAEVEITDVNDVGAIALTTYHGRQAMHITVAGATYYDTRVAEDSDILLGGVDTGDNLYTSPNGQVIAKASWNYWLVDHDGSHGIHNPTFIISALTFAKQALDALDFTIP